MAHLVYTTEGEASMAYVGELPWHGLGQKLPEDAPLEVWAKKAHLEWGVGESVVQYHIPGFRDMPIGFSFDNRKTLYRTDTMEPLEVVSKNYRVVQPIEILEFYRDLVENYGWKMHTAGSLDEGRRVWALAKMCGDVRIKGQDRIEQYALLATSYDKTLSTTFMPTSVRVVCNNTLSFAYDSPGDGCIKIPHCDKFDPNRVKIEAGLLDDTFGQFTDKIDKMSGIHVTEDFAVRFFMNLMHDERMGDDYTDVMVEGPKSKAIDAMIDQYSSGLGSDLVSSDETLWGLLNAVTAYVDHDKPARTINNRFKAGQWGPGAAIKKAAWAAASDYMEKLAA